MAQITLTDAAGRAFSLGEDVPRSEIMRDPASWPAPSDEPPSAEELVEALREHPDLLQQVRLLLSAERVPVRSPRERILSALYQAECAGPHVTRATAYVGPRTHVDLQLELRRDPGWMSSPSGTGALYVGPVLVEHVQAGQDVLVVYGGPRDEIRGVYPLV